MTEIDLAPDGYPDAPADREEVDLIEEFDQAIAALLRRIATVEPNRRLPDMLAIADLEMLRNRYMDAIAKLAASPDPTPITKTTTRRTTNTNKENTQS